MGLPTRAINYATYRAKKPDRSRGQQETLAYAEAALTAAKRDGIAARGARALGGAGRDRYHFPDRLPGMGGSLL